MSDFFILIITVHRFLLQHTRVDNKDYEFTRYEYKPHTIIDIMSVSEGHDDAIAGSIQCGQTMYEKLRKVLTSTSLQPAETPVFGPDYPCKRLEGDGMAVNEWQLEAMKQSGHEVDCYHGRYVGENEDFSPGQPYWNEVHETGKVILCMFNFRDLGASQKPMSWKDIMTATCADVMAETGGSVTNLEAV